MRPLLVGVAAALAVALPAALFAAVLDAVVDGDLPNPVTVPLALVVLAGAVVGGWAVRRQGAGPVHAALAGAVALALVAGLVLLRRAAADDDLAPALVPAQAALGALLALAGWAPAAPARPD